MFQKHISSPWCKIQTYYLYVQGMGATPADHVKGSKDIEQMHNLLERVV